VKSFKARRQQIAFENCMGIYKRSNTNLVSAHMKKHYLSVLLLLTCTFCHGQKITFEDSMRVIIFGQAPDSAKLRALIIMNNYYVTNNLDSAERYTQVSMEFAKRKKDIRLIAGVYAYMSDIAAKKNDFVRQINLLSKSLELMENTKNLSAVMSLNTRLADAYLNANDIQGAKELAQKNQGLLLTRDSSIKPIQNVQLPFLLGRIALKEKKFKAALSSFLLSLQNAAYRKDKKDWLHARLYKNVAQAYSGLSDHASAIRFFKKGIWLNKYMNNLDELSSCEQGLAEVLVEKKQNDSALFQLRHSEMIANRWNDKNSLLNAYNRYIDLYDQQKDYKKKSHYLALKLHLEDSLNRLAFAKEVANAKIKFTTERKEKENLILQEKNKTLELSMINARNQIIISIALGLGICIALLFWNRYYKLSNRKKNMELEHKLFRSQISPHFIFNSLSSIQGFILAEAPLKAAKYLSTFSKLIRSIFENSRKEFVSIEEELGSLKLYLELEKLRSNHLFEFHFETAGVPDRGILIPPMLIQPHIENAVKHGLTNITSDDPGKIVVSIFFKNKDLFCEIEDNGIGVNKARELQSNYSLHKSAGIEITNNRLKHLCKTMRLPYHFSIRDKKDLFLQQTGTLVSFLLPYKCQDITSEASTKKMYLNHP
jgi:hypothetical protein